MDPNKMETKEMVRCQVTGKLYPMDECEVVVVKIVKAKSADINSLPIFNDAPRARVDVMRDAPSPEAAPRVVNIDRPIEAKVVDTPPAPVRPKKNIVPPHMLGVMIPQDHPRFESMGAKETRRV